MRYAFLLCLCAALPIAAQTFNSGSTGADGALNLTTPGTIVFDPKTFSPPLDPDGDGVYHFTTITIGAGVTVRLRGDIINQPVVWLAQGAVQVNGTIDVSGQNGFLATNTTQRTNTIPGAGGFPGGYPGVGSNPAGAGLGPSPAVVCQGNSGSFTGNQYLVPLMGGSGGGGGASSSGSAGGGGILVASSSSISGTGGITAKGGDSTANPSTGTSGAGGIGGSIRLVAPAINITGNLNVSGGSAACNGNGYRQKDGVVRAEAFQIGALSVTGPLYTATPFGLYSSTFTSPALRVLSVGGVPVVTSPTGTFTVPDITVNSSSPLPVAIEASNVPVGTIVTLTIFSENGPDQTIQSTPLAGTLAASTATANLTLPSGFSKGFLTATFTQ